MTKAECRHEIAREERSPIERSEKAQEIAARLANDKYNADLWMEYGLALSEQALFREAVEAYSKAITINPFNGIYYRHRGHRHISCRQYEEAAADFTLASRLIPNNWDVWYHLGLSYYLMGEYEDARKAYKNCYEISEAVDQFCACTDWYWRTLMRLGETEEAAKLIEHVDPNLDPDADWVGYSRTVLLYKGVLSPEKLMEELVDASALATPTIAYCLSNYYYMQGDMEKSNKALEFLLDFCKESWWSAFGYLAGLNDKAARAQ